jgi:hypothetical protein
MLFFCLICLILIVYCYCYEECDKLQSRLDTHRHVLHRGMHKEVHAAILRPNNDSVIVKRGPSKALQRELDIYETLARRATFVPRLWGYCQRSSDTLFVQERVIPLAYASMCISLLSVASRLLFARRLAQFVRALIARELLHCDFHRGQIGVRLLSMDSHDNEENGSVAQFVLLDAEQLMRANDVNRILNNRCSSDSQCQALIQCYSMHHPYADQTCSGRRCANITPANALVMSLADLMEQLLSPKVSRESKSFIQRFPAQNDAFASNGLSRDSMRQLSGLFESMRKKEPTQRISIDRVLSELAEIGGVEESLPESDRHLLEECIGMEDEFAIQSCKDQKYC